jgi:hypothetical protein
MQSSNLASTQAGVNCGENRLRKTGEGIDY